MASLGTISGQVRLDVRQAVAAYAALRAANAATLFALRGSGAAFIAAGSAATAGGLAIAAGFAYAIKAAAEFERRLDFFGAVSASTEADMDRVRAKALELGKDTIYSANQIADSFIELGKAGVSAEMIVNGVGEAVANLGAAADIPLDQAAMIMTAAVQTYDLAAQDAVRVTDLLAGAANASIVEVEDLGVSLKYVGGVANAVSISLEDTITALSILGKAGIRGSTAGTSLRQILVSLSGTSKKASGVLKELGIITEDGSNKFFTAEGKAKSLSEIFQVLNDHTADLTEAQRLAAFKIIFNNRALSAASILSRAGAEGFAEMNAEIGKTTAADVAAKRLDNLSGDIEILKGQLETLAIEAGTPFQEVGRQVVQFASMLVQAFSSLDPATQKLIFQVVAITGGLLLFFGMVNLGIGTVLYLARNLLLMGNALKFVGKAALAAARGMALFFGVGLGPFLLIVAAVAAVAGALYLLYTRSETARRVMDAIANEVVVSFQNMVAWFRTLPAFFSNLWNSISEGATSGWDAIGTFFTTTIPAFFSQMVSTVTSTVSGWWSSVVTYFSNLYTGVTTWVSQTVTAVIDWFGRLPGMVGAALGSLASTAASFLAQLPAQIAYGLGFMVGFIIRLGAMLIEGIVTAFVGVVAYATIGTIQVVTAIGNGLAAIPGIVSRFFTVTIPIILARMVVWAQSAASGAAMVLARITIYLQQLPARVGAWFQRAAASAAQYMLQMATRASTAAANLMARVGAYFSQLPGRVQLWFAMATARAVVALSNLVAQAGAAASRALSAITSGLAGLPGLVGGLFNRAVDAIRGVATQAFAAARNVGSSLWEGFKDGLGISSPSYIERAMFTINDTLKAETALMARNIGAVQRVGDRLGVQLAEPLAAATLSMQAELEAQRRLGAEAMRLGVTRRDAPLISPGTNLANATAAPVIVQAPAATIPDRMILEVEGHEFTAFVRDVSTGVSDDISRALYAGRRE